MSSTDNYPNKWNVSSLGNRSHIGADEFKQINWLPINEILVQQFLNCPACNCKEMFSTCYEFLNVTLHWHCWHYNVFCKGLVYLSIRCYLILSRKTNKWQKACFGPYIWNSINCEHMLIKMINHLWNRVEHLFFHHFGLKIRYQRTWYNKHLPTKKSEQNNI